VRDLEEKEQGMTPQSAARAHLVRQDKVVPATAKHARDQARAATNAFMVVDEAHHRDGVASVEWERRGLLGRLVRTTPG
jgi:hypothetical protein